MRIMHRMLPKNWQVYSSLLPMAVQLSLYMVSLAMERPQEFGGG